LDKQEQVKKDHNPDYEDLFAEPKIEEEKKPEDAKDTDIEIDSRNYQLGIGFIDVMGFRIANTRSGEQWQNLWLRFATDMDKKSENTKGKDSRFYKYEKSKMRNKTI